MWKNNTLLGGCVIIAKTDGYTSRCGQFKKMLKVDKLIKQIREADADPDTARKRLCVLG